MTLSGGNQQKLVLARWIAAGSEVLVLDEPTRGVDVGAKAELHAWIDRLAAAGAAVLLISSELPELIGLSTRILVMRRGQLAGEVPRGRADQATVLRLIEIATDCISVPGAWIEIDCWLPLVLTPSSAEIIPDTRTWMTLPRALPSMLPPTWRVFSDQVPDTAPLLWVALLCSSKL